ncbi:hypothetical protein [Streptomyces sp. NBC_01190]|uniref:hypothetical protein n=1 Tax=Streptomyces sp. NBC_01190 TaxID=2903767 RepID=UPI00386C3643|nr:hypothetical protein OG519_28940 [Streptomyces sp. NBC_01190]
MDGRAQSEVAKLILLTTTDTNGILPRLHEFLETAADMTNIVDRLGELDEDLYYMAVDAWEDINTAQRRTNAATSTSPAAGTRPTTAAPAPPGGENVPPLTAHVHAPPSTYR